MTTTWPYINQPGAIIWILGLSSVLFWIMHLTLQQPKRQRLILGSYWLLFILTPMVVFALATSFSYTALLFGVPLFFVLVVLGEHGLRLWEKMFGRRR